MQVFGIEYAWLLLAASIIMSAWNIIRITQITDIFNDAHLIWFVIGCSSAVAAIIVCGAVLLLTGPDNSVISSAYGLWRVGLLLSLICTTIGTIIDKAKQKAY